MINVIYEDAEVIVCIKPVGVLSQESTHGEESMVSILRKDREYIAPVHRLDRAVSGLMVYAKTDRAAAELARQVQDRTMKKQYLAVIHGAMQEKEDILEDILFKDSAKNKSFVVKTLRKGAKKASLAYRVLAEAQELSLVHILLHTGRTHQIRVQFSSRKHPLYGDGKYGGRDNAKAMALWSAGISFLHPRTKKLMRFWELPEKTHPWSLFADDEYYDIKELQER